MSIVNAGKLINNVLGGVDSIANFSQAARTFVPSFNVCPQHPAYDQYGRPSGYGALNTLSAPGCFSIEETILNENSLRPPLSSNPLYKNIQAGVGGNGADTMFGMGLPGRAYSYGQNFNFNINNASKCIVPQYLQGAYNFPENMLGDSGSCYQDVDMLPGAVASGRTSDMIKVRPNFM
jgi:hypothetical protein